jgi:hypothetical protein
MERNKIMLSNVLYSMLLGALSVLYIGAFIGIIKLVCFLVKKILKKPPSKKIIIIASCVILGIAAIVLAVSLIPRINISHKGSDTLDSQIAELEEENNRLKSELETAKVESNSLSGQLESVSQLCEEQESLISEYMSEIEFLENKLLSFDPDNVTYSYSFNSVEELNYAIKKAPFEYVDRLVKVTGTVYKKDDGVCYLIDLYGVKFPDSSGITSADSFSLRYYALRPIRESRYIVIKIPDSFLFAAIDTGDYINIYGSVTQSQGEMCLINCEYNVIATAHERIKGE